MGANHRIIVAAAVATAAVLSFTGIFDHSLWTPDEPRVAEIGRAMQESGDFLVPRLGHEPFLEKPPLHWWVMSGFFAAFGVSDGMARFPSALFGFLVLLLAFDMARRAGGPRAGLFAVGVLATTASFYHMHRALTDPSLAFFVTLGFWAFQRAAFPVEGRGRPGGWIFIVYVATGLGFLSKGIVAPVLLAGPIVLYVLLARRWDLLRSWAHLPGLAAFAAFAAAWPLLLNARGGRELLDGFLVDNVLNRFLPGKSESGPGGHKAPPWGYFKSLPPMLLPWLLAVPTMIRLARRDRERRPAAFAWLAATLPLGVLLLSVPATKRDLYVLPLLAPAAAAVGLWLVATTRTHTPDRWDHGTLAVIRWLAVLLLVGVGAMGAAFLVGVPASWGKIADVAARAPVSASTTALVLSVVALAILVWKRGAEPALRTVAIWCALALVVNVAAYRILDPMKDLRPFVAGLVEKKAFEPDLIGYRLDETTVGLIPYHTGRIIDNIENRGLLKAYFEEHPDANLLVFERFLHRIPASLRERLETTGRWAASDRRVYLLMRLAR